jgi:prepilin-type N-terminal cleavage/methylation domain-containing protein
MLTRPASAAFTLVELLVVVAIIGVLVGLLLPAVQAAREAGRRLECADHLKQIGLAHQAYHAAFGSFPPGSLMHRRPDDSGASWHVLLLPFLEQQPLFDELCPIVDGGVTGATYAKFTVIKEFGCPSAVNAVAHSDRLAPSNYSGVAGAGRHGNVQVPTNPSPCGNVFTDGVFYPNSNTRLRDISDGSSHTLAVGERTYFIEPWIDGSWWIGRSVPSLQIETHCLASAKNVVGPINADPSVHGCWLYDTNCRAGAERDRLRNDLYFGSDHPGGAQFAVADGSVQFLVDSIDLDVYWDLATRNGDEPNRWQQ